MKPKSRKEILDICQDNFLSYSTLNKVAIIVAVLLSAGSLALYLCKFILPTIKGIICSEIVGWDVIWKVFLAFLYFIGIKYINLFCVSIGGVAICREENWNLNDFSKAWLNIYKYEDYIKTEEKENSENLDN